MSKLSQQAFSVFCDELNRDAVEKNNSLRVENASLEPLRNSLMSAKAHFAGDQLLADMHLSEYDDHNEDEEYLSYSLHDVAEIPYERINDLDFSISGIRVKHLLRAYGLKQPRLTILEDSETPSAELVGQFTSEVRITGVLKNFAGTLHDVQSMIESNRFVAHFYSLGMVNAETGVPARFRIGDYCLEGAAFTLTKIELLKRVIQPVLACNETAVNAVVMQEVNELETLARADETHQGLAKVADERKALVNRNAVLKACHDCAQSVKVH